MLDWLYMDFGLGFRVFGPDLLGLECRGLGFRDLGVQGFGVLLL